MARHWKIAIVVLVCLALIGLAGLPALLRSVMPLQRAAVSEEQARRELSQTAVSTPNDKSEQAHLFWLSANSAAALESTQMELPLSADPVQRSKQLITALIAQAPSAAQRTLPGDTELLQFYLLPDGTAIADFSEALSTETPSGILSEQMAVDSLVRTLAENVSAVHRLKIIIRGQETDTLAGHLDLTGFFPVEPAAPVVSRTALDSPAVPPSPPAQPPKPGVVTPVVAAPTAATPAAPSAGNTPAAATPAAPAPPVRAPAGPPAAPPQPKSP